MWKEKKNRSTCVLTGERIKRAEQSKSKLRPKHENLSSRL